MYSGVILDVMFKDVNWTLKASNKAKKRQNVKSSDDTWIGNVTFRNGEIFSGTWNSREGMTHGTIVYDNDSEFQFYYGEIKNYTR